LQKAIIRKAAPAFQGTAFWQNKFQQISLEQFRGQYVCLFFWPLDFTFVCPTEICQFNDKEAEFKKLNTQLVGCSIDSHFTHMEYTKKPRNQGGLGPMTIPMLSDKSHQIAKDYGCLIEDGGDAGIAFRATYIIDDKGILRHQTIGDLPVGRSVDETLRLVEAFQYTDKHGEVCPASWTPGAATMKPGDDAQLASFWQNSHAKKV